MPPWHVDQGRPLPRRVEGEPAREAMWDGSAGGQAGAMIFLTSILVLVTVSLVVAMAITPLLADS